jgi:hypothetical protein
VWINGKSYKNLTQEHPKVRKEVVPLLELSFKKKIKELSFFHGDFLWKHSSEVESYYLARFEALNKNLECPLIQIDKITEKNYRFRLKVEDSQIIIPALLELEGIENLAAVARKIYSDERRDMEDVMGWENEAKFFKTIIGIGRFFQGFSPKDLSSLADEGSKRCYSQF